jgi:hypothetical protein
MPMTKVFFDKLTDEFHIATFGRDEISDCATGPLIKMTKGEFLQCGVSELDKQLREFFDRDATIPSELYETMPEPERELFLEKNSVVTISWNNKADFVKIYAGRNFEFVQEASFPLQSPEFITNLIRILEES